MKSYNLIGLSRKRNILAASNQSNPTVDFIGKCLQGSPEMIKRYRKLEASRKESGHLLLALIFTFMAVSQGFFFFL